MQCSTVLGALGVVRAWTEAFVTPSDAQVVLRKGLDGAALTEQLRYIPLTYDRNKSLRLFSGKKLRDRSPRCRRGWPPPCSQLFTRSRSERLPIILPVPKCDATSVYMG